jgi:hypothetical protein
MSKQGLSLTRRLVLRALQWAISDVDQSNTHPINSLFYQRSHFGRSLAPSHTHPQVRIGSHTYGFRRETFFAYHPDDRVVIG